VLLGVSAGNTTSTSIAMSEDSVSRRRFILGATAGAVLPTALAQADSKEIRGELPWAPRQADVPRIDASPEYRFFTVEEAAFIDAATERLIPQDELGPGANALGVTLFIDHQLAGSFGRAERWYMQGPWSKGESTQGFQSRMAPAILYRTAIQSIEKHVSSGQAGKRFAQLTAEQQDDLLKGLEAGKIELDAVDAKTFFKVLLQNTKEGAFADPMYGGNKDMAGWKMLGFPGARYDYLDWVDRHNVKYALAPVAILGRAEWHKAG
jgi:gluconate 2-dehydrogenase gamma chain